MSAIGPELPPHLLAKRKRRQQDDEDDEATVGAGAKRSSSPAEGEKRRRVIGPAMPPATLDERPLTPPHDTGESDGGEDDDLGPSLPPTGMEAAPGDTANGKDGATAHIDSPASESKPKRDEWMMIPPKQDDLAARMDPSKPRRGGFSTGKGARGPSAAEDDSSAWHETPEQKQKRLADEMMGVSKPSKITSNRPSRPDDLAKDKAAARQIKDHTKARGPSLLERHEKGKGADTEDDPSKRAFDREKDMGSGMRIGNVQRQQMLNKASDYSSKFSGGSYL